MSERFSGPDTPNTQALFDRMHANHGLKKVKVSADSSDSKAGLYGLMGDVLDHFRREEKPDVADLSGFEKVAALPAVIRRAQTHDEIMNALLSTNESVLLSMMNGFHKRHMSTVLSPSRHVSEVCALISTVNRLLLIRDGGSGRANIGENGAFFRLAMRGFTSQRIIGSGILDVIPRVALEKYDVILSPAEYEQIGRDSISLIRPVTDTHMDIFSCLRKVMRSRDTENYSVPNNQVEPFDVQAFLIRKRSDRLSIHLTKDAADMVEEMVREGRKAGTMLKTPLVGCAASAIVPAIHRLIVRIAGPALYPQAVRLATLPVTEQEEWMFT